MNKIIAVVGMTGSGKSIACDYYESIGFKKVYFGGVTLDKLKELNLEINEVNERKIREELRQKYGMGAYAYILLPKIEEYLKEGNVVLDGLYSWSEYKILKDKFKDNFIMLSIVLNKKDRYSRLENREIRSLSNIDAEKRDIAEIENLEKGGPIAYADYYILNNKNIDEYKKDLENMTKKIME